MIPRTYGQWHHCITVECGIPLTPDYIAQRLIALHDTQSDAMLRFRRLYGDQHLQNVQAWFERAMLEYRSGA